MLKKQKKALVAVFMSVVMLSATILVNANNANEATIIENVYNSLCAENLSKQRNINVKTAFAEASFIDFVGTFSGLEGSLSQIVELFEAATSFSEFNESVIINPNVVVQLDALQNLYFQGVRNADEWLEETTIDLSPYGDFWVFINYETGNEYNYAIVDGKFIQIEVGFTPNCMEILALRQALLSAYTITNFSSLQTEEIYSEIQVDQQVMPFIDANHNLTVIFSRPAPFNSIGRLFTTFYVRNSGEETFTGTAFLVHSNVAVTAGHNLFNPGITNGASGHVRRMNLNLSGRSVTAGGAWVHPEWIRNANINTNQGSDQAVIVFANNAFPGIPFLQLRPTTSLAGLPNRLQHAGYPVRYGDGTLHSFNGLIATATGNRNTFEQPMPGAFMTRAMGARGISGGPAFYPGTNRVYGIMVAVAQGHPRNAPASFSRITQNFVSVVNTIIMQGFY